MCRTASCDWQVAVIIRFERLPRLFITNEENIDRVYGINARQRCARGV